MEIYAPLAERLGIWQVKWELEDLSFKALDPERYRELAANLDTRRQHRETYVDRAMAILTPELEKSGIVADLNGRPKHLYSIWKKMQRKAAAFGEIYDVYAIRLLVDEVRDCYAALGVVHSLWKPIPGQFDDYIAVPKPNGYQSLHTAVIALDGKPLEIQIRTHAMHAVSEVGIAAHWRYKEGSRAERDYDAKLAWLRQLMDWQREVSDAQEFVEGIKLDIFQDQVFVFTPKGDIKDLPAGATPLDFAYRIHTDVGHRTIGSKVNNRLVPLDYRLRNGDIVEIVTTKAEHGPSRDWMAIVRTSHAREKIRQWFKKKDRDENIVHGKDALERELKRLARTTGAAVGHDRLLEAAKHHGQESLDDFYAAIGYGAISAQSVVMRLGVVDDAQLALPATAPAQARAGGVRVKGVGDLLVRFGKCCHPIPGDPIVGFITRGKGVTVHLNRCPTIVNEREVARLIDVEWEAAPAQTYPIAIRVEAYDRTGLLNDIAGAVAESKVNIVAANVSVTLDHTAVVVATLQVASVSQLARVMGRIEQVKDVIAVQRDLG
jgi:GTP pyrophosphokinase